MGKGLVIWVTLAGEVCLRGTWPFLMVGRGQWGEGVWTQPQLQKKVCFPQWESVEEHLQFSSVAW